MRKLTRARCRNLWSSVAMLIGITVPASHIAFAQSAPPATNVGHGAKIADGGRGVPLAPDQKMELALKITQPFTVVAVGDLLEFQPFAMTNDPRTAGLVKRMREADITVGDFENEIYDFDNFGHAGGNLATKEVADDWVRMGIDIVSRANNKPTRAPGIWENFRQVERVGITHVGVARSLPEARMARYVATPKGLVGEIGVSADGGLDACCSGGQIVIVTPAQLEAVRAIRDSILSRRSEVEVPVADPVPEPAGSLSVFGVTFRLPGVDAPAPKATGAEAVYREVPPGPQDAYKNSLHVTLYQGVTAAQMATLREIARDSGHGDLHAFGTRFRIMDQPGEHSFDMNPADLKDILVQVRTAKQASDLLILNAHWHQNRYDFQAYSHDHFPADFEIAFAHAAVDQGVDVFVAQGVHTIKGVEIYHGKPIFYGVSNFVFQSALMPQGKGKLPPVPGRAETGEAGPAPQLAAGAEAAPEVPQDGIVGEHERQGFWQLKANLEALLVESVFNEGRLKEVRLHPIDLGQTPRPGSQVGVPRIPEMKVAKKILDEVVEYSKPFGTHIVIENGVGIIRL
ncbi:MAG: CapA family protein [Sphingobium sp.]|nr:CapA family protein [Sphingobium sp.]